jgi:hypothetical protein
MRRSPVSHEPDSEAGRPILLSFAELRGIHINLATLNAKLDTFSNLPGDLRELQDRVTTLETDKAVRNARSGLYGKWASLAWAVALVIIGAGAGAWVQKVIH